MTDSIAAGFALALDVMIALAVIAGQVAYGAAVRIPHMGTGGIAGNANTFHVTRRMVTAGIADGTPAGNIQRAATGVAHVVLYCKNIRRHHAEHHDEGQHQAQKTFDISFHFFFILSSYSKFGKCARPAPEQARYGSEACIPLFSRWHRRQVRIASPLSPAEIHRRGRINAAISGCFKQLPPIIRARRW